MADETSYKRAGVDIEAGYEAVRRIKRHALATRRPEALNSIGAFGGLFALDVAKYRQPVLVAGADGVGTKLKVGFMTGKHDTIGIDVVAYCVNDIVCQGAEPLFFLDYLAVGKLDPTVAEAIVAGVAQGCKEAGCALIGGETAEMPGFYPPGEYDLAGFAVGAVERDGIIDGTAVRPGDVVIGIESTGLQSSGYSLVRHIVFEKAKLSVDRHVEELGRTVGEELLTPTGIYVKALLDVIASGDARGIANISGGGLPENLPRAAGPGLSVEIQRGSWPIPPVFPWLQALGGVTTDEMYKTFNMGVGMAVIVPPHSVDQTSATLLKHGWRSWPIGEVKAGEGGVAFRD